MAHVVAPTEQISDIVEEDARVPMASPGRLAVRRFFRHRLAVAGGIGVLVLIILAVFAPNIAPRDPNYLDLRVRFTPPFTNPHFLLGSDEMGRDLVSRLLYGGRVSLTVGFTAMGVTILIGTLLGSISGFYGRALDSLLMRFTDTVLCFPAVFLLLVLASFFTPTVASISLIIGLTSWMPVTRIVRSQTLSLKELDFVTAARAMGATNWRIIFKEIIPNGVAPIVVAATLNVANAVLLESYISYLGYGIQRPLATWGNMLQDAQSYFDTAPWMAIIPGIMITLTVMGFNFLGDGLRDALDPRLKI